MTDTKWNETILPLKIIAMATGMSVRRIQQMAPDIVEKGLAVKVQRIYVFHPLSIGYIQQRVKNKNKITETYLGTVCRRGHVYAGTGKSMRYASSKGCIECTRLFTAGKIDKNV